ncbi:MAG TPA: ABC transporter permease [Myxococcaceae bacterium]|jgi:putative ABC transport system permease protein
MNWMQTTRVALRALLRNKMRSFLTVLGVIIGVGAVIAMVALGEGAKKRVQDSFASMGSDLLIVLPGSTSRGGSFGGFGSMPTLTWDDVRAIQTELSSVRAAAPQLRSNAPVLAEDMNWTTSVTGTSPAFFSIRAWPTAQGSIFSESDVDGANKVIVLGNTVSEKLFGPGVDPTGRTVRVKNIPFVVAGVLAKKGQSPNGQDYDDAVFVPQSTFQAKIQGGLQKFVSGAVLVGAQPGQTARAERQISDLLRDRHHLPQGADDDFSIRNMAEVASSQEDSVKTFTSLLAAIAAVSLAVGGIGIMNIMLVSVTERTREIGLRMAVGAKPRHVLLQFLVEALSLSAAGGLIGVAAGIGVARWLGDSFGWPVLIRTDIVAVSVAFSGLVGVAFGLYPALKASRLDPIDALRFE